MADPTRGDVAVAQQTKAPPVVLPAICTRCKDHVAVTRDGLCPACDDHLYDCRRDDEQDRAIEAAEFRGAA